MGAPRPSSMSFSVMLVTKADEVTGVAAGAAALLLDASPAADMLFASLGHLIVQVQYDQTNDL